jgi:hypothetical protein
MIVGATMTATAATGGAFLWSMDWEPGGAVAENAAAVPEPSPPLAPDVTKVCIGPDRVVRSPSGDECPPNHKEVPLEEEDSGLCDLCDPFSDPQKASASKDLNALEQRLASLERTPFFEVVDARDNPVLRVSADGVRLFSRQGVPLAAIGTTETGGFITTRSTSQQTDVQMGTTGNTGGMRITESGLLRVDLTAKGERVALRFPTATGLIAGLGESNAGTGTMLLGTLPGKTKVKFMVSEARGLLDVSQNEIGGIVLAEAKVGGGLLDLANKTGASAVRMGHNGHKYGIVLAGPVLGLPLVPKSGLPGSYFMGCASGEKPACMPEVGSAQ